MMRRYLALVAILLSVLTVDAQNAKEGVSQSARKYVKQGNRYMQRRGLNDAETAYRKALEQDPNTPQAL